jgi:putative FmdB family regulatory protein
MPIFEYICKECDHQFEALIYGKEKAECPKCHSKKLTTQLSVFAVSAKGASTSSAQAGPCGSCSSSGACPMANMD